MTDVELIAVLDGAVRLADGRRVPWGAVIVQSAGDSGNPMLPSSGRTICVHHALEIRRDALTRSTPVIRDPALFAACLIHAAGGRTAASLNVGVLVSASFAPRILGFREPIFDGGWLAAVRGMLHDEFMLPLQMRQIARRVGIHPVHVSRAFAHRYGVTMTQYLRHLRLARASELLATTEQLLSPVALGTGFADHAHFTRAYVEGVGIPPSEFRRLARRLCAA